MRVDRHIKFIITVYILDASEWCISRIPSVIFHYSLPFQIPVENSVHRLKFNEYLIESKACYKASYLCVNYTTSFSWITPAFPVLQESYPSMPPARYWNNETMAGSLVYTCENGNTVYSSGSEAAAPMYILTNRIQVSQRVLRCMPSTEHGVSTLPEKSCKLSFCLWRGDF